jgi:hypothetical protein
MRRSRRARESRMVGFPSFGLQPRGKQALTRVAIAGLSQVRLSQVRLSWRVQARLTHRDAEGAAWGGAARKIEQRLVRPLSRASLKQVGLA